MYDFYVDKYKEILSTPNRITKLPPRVMIALDKGTSRNDYGHQGVHCTVVTEEGFSKEIVLSANICGATGQEVYMVFTQFTVTRTVYTVRVTHFSI